MTKQAQKIKLTAEQHKAFRGLCHDAHNSLNKILSSLRSIGEVSRSKPDFDAKLGESYNNIIDQGRESLKSRAFLMATPIDKPVEIPQDRWRLITGRTIKILSTLNRLTDTLAGNEDTLKAFSMEDKARQIRVDSESATRCFAAILDGSFKHKLEPKLINPNEFVRDFLSQPVVDREGKPVKVEFTQGKVNSINTDPIRLRIALDNLVSDAVNHHPENTVVIETKGSGDKASIYVISGGLGEPIEPIPDELLTVIGRRVYTTSNPTAEKPFRGFGKVTTRNFCLESHGEFTVENRDGRPCLGMHFPKANK